jgi:(E)-4-hydroxy-3-methylbut-2-enyl-diphosphate synthase
LSNTVISQPITLNMPGAAGARGLAYCADPYSYKRRKTRVVMVGPVGVGGDNPIRIQSMTTTLTKDVEATYAQTMRLIDVGCEIVRITTPTTADAKALGEVKRRLLAQGIHTPLVADIHFSPGAAMEAALWADKVRINPGNFADAKKFQVLEYTDAAYADELARIEEKVAPLLLRCKERGVSMRVGTNHGSLSDRIMNRYGDTPLGMVESALEFIRICEKYEYYDLIVSMKASNPKVMIQAYRLLAARMGELGMDYPFHLGVTEAGNGEDGRLKSAIGIGALLEDGLGDTIRVSLTEDPEYEVPVAYALAGRYTPRDGRPGPGDGTLHPVAHPAPTATPLPDLRDSYGFDPRWTHAVQIGKSRSGGNLPAQVIVSLAGRLAPLPGALTDVLALARRAGEQGVRADVLSVGVTGPADLETLRKVVGEMRDMKQPFPVVAITGNPAIVAPALEAADGLKLALIHGQDNTRLIDAYLAAPPVGQGSGPGQKPVWIDLLDPRADRELATAQEEHRFEIVDALVAIAERLHAAKIESAILSMTIDEPGYRLRAYRLLDSRLRERGYRYPLHLIATNIDPADEAHLLHSAVSIGALLTDGIGASVQTYGRGDFATRLVYTFNLLQAAGARLSKTEFVACPSCGRTLFDLQSTTERIKARTGHLVGVKIAVMGCIVNGLGELADADFGYMGGAPDKVNLFVGKECIEKNVPAEIAVDKLITLIKAHGRWVEPGQAAEADSA